MTPIRGNTFPVKDQLRALGGRWDAVAKCWLVPDDKVDEANRILAGAAKASRPQLVPLRRSGLFSELAGIAPVTYQVRATSPAVEALLRARAIVIPLGLPEIGYQITLGPKMPSGIIACHLNGDPWVGIRMSNEPRFPGEQFDYWLQVDFLPCPKCGAPVVWYEAGYVPGYRVCTGEAHHHSIAK